MPDHVRVMQDPVVASDERVRAWCDRGGAGAARGSAEEPLTRAVLQPFLFPNIALKNRIATHEQEVEAAAEAAQKADKAERTK